MFADKLAAITGFSFPDEGGVVNNLYASVDDVPDEVRRLLNLFVILSL